MSTICSKCDARLPMVTELMHIFADGDPIRMMELLVYMTSVASQQGLLSPGDYQHISELHFLLAAIVRQRETGIK